MRDFRGFGRPFLVGSFVAASVLASLHCGGSGSTAGTGGSGGFVSIGSGPSTSSSTMSTSSGAGAGTSSSSTASASSSGTGGGSSSGGVSVLTYHYTTSRAGTTVDAALTKAAAGMMHVDGNFNAMIDGAAYAQPLFLDDGGGGKDRVFVATEKNQVYSLDALTGAVIWNHKLGPEVAVSKLQCGNIDPYGVTGTPVIDLPSRTMFLDAIVDGGNGPAHQVFALSIDDGTTKAGWPIDANSKFSYMGFNFDSTITGERGALTILGDTVYIPYGGLWGDCGNYRGWVVGIKMADPTKITTWTVGDRGGGIWAPGGLSIYGNELFGATGNTFTGNTWNGGEAVIGFSPGPIFTQNNGNFWAPKNWKQLDDGDVDMSGTGPIVFGLAGATPSTIVAAFGKDKNAYLLDAGNLGGIADAVVQKQVSNNEIIGSATAYQTTGGTFIAVKGQCTNGNGNLIGLKIGAAAPPTIDISWCGDQGGSGTPMSTTSDGKNDAIVWAVGSEGDNRLHGFDGATGKVVFDGGGQNDQMSGVARFATPIAAKGRIYVAGTDAVYAFAPQM